jgi:hypothetical protein
MVLETLVFSPFNHMTRLVARENFIELSILYERKEFYQVSGALNLHQVILSSGIQNSLAEVQWRR